MTAKSDEPKLLKIGEFAELAGTNLRTLRYYEEIGLITPASRSQGGFRYYRETDVNRLNMIHTLQDLGLSLERIRDLMTTRNGKPPVQGMIQQVRTALGAQDELLSERMRELEERRNRIKSAVEKLAECETCDHHPTPENNFCEPCALDGESLPEDLSALF